MQNVAEHGANKAPEQGRIRFVVPMTSVLCFEPSNYTLLGLATLKLDETGAPTVPIETHSKIIQTCHIMSHHHVTSFHDHVDGAQSHGKAHQRPKWPHPRRLAQVVRARVAIGSAVPWHNTRLSKYVKLVKLGSLKISLPCGCKESGHSEYIMSGLQVSTR